MDSITRTGNGARAASTLNIIAGIWLIISAFFLHFSTVRGAMANDLIIGIVVLILAAVRVWTAAAPGLSWVNFVLGIWLIISPYVLAFTTMRSFVTNNIIVGIIVACLAAWSAMSRYNPAIPQP